MYDEKLNNSNDNKYYIIPSDADIAIDIYNDLRRK